MSAHIHGVREQLVVTLYGSTLPDLLRFAANWIETRRENGVLSADIGRRKGAKEEDKNDYPQRQWRALVERPPVE